MPDKKWFTASFPLLLSGIKSVFWDFDSLEPPQIVRTAQKGTYVGEYEVLSGEATRKRRLSSL